MDFKELLNLKYNEACNYLINKYGHPKANYFNENWVKQKRISRTIDGLYCHHIFEDRYLKLSDPEYAKKAPIEAQYKENLLYCSAIEHLILHLLIYKEKHNMSQGGIIYTLCECNLLYGEVKGWRQSCYGTIKDNYEDYINLLVDNYNIIISIFKNYPASRNYLGDNTDLIAVKEWAPQNISINKKILCDIRSKLI